MQRLADDYEADTISLAGSLRYDVDPTCYGLPAVPLVIGTTTLPPPVDFWPTATQMVALEQATPKRA